MHVKTVEYVCWRAREPRMTVMMIPWSHLIEYVYSAVLSSFVLNLNVSLVIMLLELVLCLEVLLYCVPLCAGEFVAQFKFTVLLMPNGPLR